MPDDPSSIAAIAERVAQVLERLRIPYAVGGSIASGVYGDPRSTQDIDFAVQLSAAQVPQFVDELGVEFEVDADALTDAARKRRSWNLFYLPMMVKIDLFVRGKEPFDESEFSRTRRVQLSPTTRPIRLSSPEDNLLWKLRWFRMGGEVSDQQWRDLKGIVRVSGPVLDLDYLNRWGQSLGVADLLARLLAEC